MNANRQHLEVLFQPTYSPHWNPVELVFGNLKHVAQHDAAFSLADGSVQGEWCPNMPSLPFVGKVGAASTPLPVFKSRVAEDGGIEVLV